MYIEPRGSSSERSLRREHFSWVDVSSEYVNAATFIAALIIAVQKERGSLTDMRVENPSLVVWKDGAPVLWLSLIHI